MGRAVILGTGPLAALLNRRDRDHDWAVAQWQDIAPPLLTCKSVLSEAAFLLGRIGSGGPSVLEMLARGARMRIVLSNHLPC